MTHLSLATTALAAALSLATAGAEAQTAGGGSAAGQGDAGAAQPGTMQGRTMQGPGRMAGPGPGMRAGRHGMMAPMMMRVMYVAIDTDSSGSLSLEEVQTFHERMFGAADADGNGELEPAELRDFMTGGFPE